MENIAVRESEPALAERIPDIPEMLDPTFTEDESYQLPPKDLIAFNESRTCAELLEMHQAGSLDLHPELQRNFSWGDEEQTRFIDSLIKDFPIPSMCFAMEYKTRCAFVIDGLQRVSTIIRFLGYQEKPWRLSRLDNVDPKIAGKTRKEIGESTDYVEFVKNVSLPFVMLRYDIRKRDHMEYIMMMFHRLNFGGMKLNNQEIRNCVFGGPLTEQLRELDQDETWRRLNRMRPGDNHRFVKQEVILRFFAFLHEGQTAYAGHMAKFLDAFMYERQDNDSDDLHSMERVFRRTVAVLDKIFDGKEPPERLPANILHPAMVGVAKNIDRLEKADASELQSRYRRLVQDPAFADVSDLANGEGVRKRLQTAQRIFDAAA